MSVGLGSLLFKRVGGAMVAPVFKRVGHTTPPTRPMRATVTAPPPLGVRCVGTSTPATFQLCRGHGTPPSPFQMCAWSRYPVAISNVPRSLYPPRHFRCVVVTVPLCHFKCVTVLPPARWKLRGGFSVCARLKWQGGRELVFSSDRPHFC